MNTFTVENFTKAMGEFIFTSPTNITTKQCDPAYFVFRSLADLFP